MSLHLTWYDWVGMTGMAMTLVAFWLLQARRLSGTGIVYQLLNLFGSAGVLVSLVCDFNLSAFLLEAVWLLISCYGIMRSFQARNELATHG